MIPTVQRQLRKKVVTQSNLTPWVTEELFPFLIEVRQGLNYTAIQSPPTFPTAGTGIMTTIWSSADLAVNSIVLMDATIIGNANTARSAFKITGLFYNDGTTTQEGVTSAGYTQNAAGFAVQFLVVSNHIELQVQDDGALTVNWDAIIEAQEVT